MSDNSAKSGDPLVGTEVARRYRVESLVRERDSCLTYNATCLRTGRRVVLVMPSQRLWEDPVILQRFFQGARTAYGLKHLGIVSVYDVGETSEGIPFLATDLVRGITVSAMLADHGRLPVQRLVNIARGVAQALAAAHKKGVARWNLAPCYVLVVSSPEGPDQVRLLDLGLTQLLIPSPSPNPNPMTTQVADEFRTQPYAAPQAAVASHVPLDVLAFGGLLFSMATGGSPGPGKVDKQIIRTAVDEPEGTGNERRARQQLIDLTLRCLADSPAARPRSMDEIVRKLDRVEDSVGLGLMERSLLEPGLEPGSGSGAIDEDTADGVPVEPINTIEQVKDFVSSGEARSSESDGIGRFWILAAVSVVIFVTGLAIGLWINR